MQPLPETRSARAVDREALRRALASFASGVNVVSVWDRDMRPYGMTASAFSAVSLDPLLVLICLSRICRTYHEITLRGRFGVNILSADARQVAEYCARPGQDKWLRSEWLRPGSGSDTSPALAQSLAHLDCSVHRDVEAGSHAIVVGSVRAVALNNDAAEPLVYYRGAYRGVCDPVNTERAS